MTKLTDTQALILTSAAQHPDGIAAPPASLPPAPRGAVSVEFHFELSNECLLTITAKEQSTGQTVTSTYATRHTPEGARQKVARLESQGPELTAAEIAAARPTGLFSFFKRLFGG